MSNKLMSKGLAITMMVILLLSVAIVAIKNRLQNNWFNDTKDSIGITRNNADSIGHGLTIPYKDSLRITVDPNIKGLIDTEMLMQSYRMIEQHSRIPHKKHKSVSSHTSDYWHSGILISTDSVSPPANCISIDSIQWVVYMDSTGHLVSSNEIVSILKSFITPNTWYARFIEDAHHLNMSINWYFIKQYGNQRILINKYPNP